MPTLVTRGAVSAYAFGLGASGGLNYYMGYALTGSNTQVYPRSGLAIDANDNVYIGAYFSYVGTYGAGALKFTKNAVLSAKRYTDQFAVNQPGNTTKILSTGNVVIGAGYSNINYPRLQITDSSLTDVYNKTYYETTPSHNDSNEWQGLSIDTSDNIYTVAIQTFNCCCTSINTLTFAKFNSSAAITYWKYMLAATPYIGVGNHAAIAVGSVASNYLYIGYVVPYTKYLITQINATTGAEIAKSSFIFNNYSDNYSSIYDMKVDSAGNLIVVGLASSAGTPVGFILKYNWSTGNVWQKFLSGDGSANQPFNYWTAVALDSSDNIYVCGGNFGYRQSSIAKYDSNGNLQWQRKIYWSVGGGSSPQFDLSGIGLDSQGALWVSGFLYHSTGQADAFFMKVPNDGSKTGTYTIGGYTFVYGVNTGTSSSPTYTTQTAPTQNITDATAVNGPNKTSIASNAYAVSTLL